MICFFLVEIRTVLYRDFTEKSMMLLIYEIVFDTALDHGTAHQFLFSVFFIYFVIS